jgi:hypothetical protein
MAGPQERQDDPSEVVSPEEFLRALMHIGADDAKEAREKSPATRPKHPKSDGPKTKDS